MIIPFGSFTVLWTFVYPNDMIYGNVIPSGLYSSLDTRYLQTTNNLSDLTSTATARTNLGLGALAVLNDLLTFDTDDLTEGTNLYYTDVRVETYCDTRYLKLTGGAITPLANSTTTFQVNQADGTNVLTVDTTNGRVGIGTATPGDMLSVVGGNISITNPAGGQIKLISTNWDDFSIRNNNGLFQIEEVGIAPRISIDSSGNVGLAGSSSTNTPALWARQDGNVGIGETSPGAKLQINTGVAATIGLIVKAAASQSANILEIQSSAAAVLAKITPTGGALFSDKVQFTQTDGNEYIDSLNDGYMDYGATTAHRFNTDDLVIDTANSFVGIGTTSPLTKLHIEGQCITGDSLLPIVKKDSNHQKTAQRADLGSTSNSFKSGLSPKNSITHKNNLSNSKAWTTGELNPSDLGDNPDPEPLVAHAKSNITQNIEYKKIKDIKGGEMVLSLDETTGKIIPAKIKGLLDMGVKPIYRLTTQDGKSIK
ncbi:hypothetical protein L6273_03115, partial [Candidatus Parcubacteria bacterium]|nr:hypothetical protein [Candidatus Parcubacteria bacterium]